MNKDCLDIRVMNSFLSSADELFEVLVNYKKFPTHVKSGALSKKRYKVIFGSTGKYRSYNLLR